MLSLTVEYQSSTPLVIDGLTFFSAAEKSPLLIFGLLFLIAFTADSLHTATRSAPLYPFVATAISFKSMSPDSGICFVNSLIISNLPFSSGGGTKMTRSSLPGRINDGSIRSGLFEIPSTTTLEAPPSSISVRSWLRSLSPTPPSSFDLKRASESSSSNIIIHGDEVFAFRNISLIAFSDSPTHFDKISGPLTSIMFAPLSVARARASNVFPHPDGPYKSAHFGGLIPIFWNFAGSFIAVIRLSSSVLFASSSPPTSFHHTFGLST